MKTAIYEHVMDDISVGDDATVLQCIEAAIGEMKSYLASRYDAARIFAATGDNRDPLVLENTKVIAVWNLIRLSNSELVYDQWRERYDRVVSFMKQVAEGSITPDLPIALDEQGNPIIKSRFGSNPKFKHDY